LRKAIVILFPSHEISSLSQIPSTLCLVEDSYMLSRWFCVSDRIITKMMNVLYECLDAFGHFPFPDFIPNAFLSCHLISGERFTKHGYKRAVA